MLTIRKQGKERAINPLHLNVLALAAGIRIALKEIDGEEKAMAERAELVAAAERGDTKAVRRLARRLK